MKQHKKARQVEGPLETGIGTEDTMTTQATARPWKVMPGKYENGTYFKVVSEEPNDPFYALVSVNGKHCGLENAKIIAASPTVRLALKNLLDLLAASREIPLFSLVDAIAAGKRVDIAIDQAKSALAWKGDKP